MKHAFSLFLALLFLPFPARAADITCAERWSETQKGFNEDVLKQRFPSGNRPTPQSCRALYINGEIKPGDAESFRSMLGNEHPFVSTVLLNSPGGSVYDSFMIGKLVRDYGLITVAPSLPQSIAVASGRLEVFPGGFISDGQYIATGISSQRQTTTLCEGLGCNCASACTNIWAAGALRFGNFLGVHQVFTQKVEGRSDVGLSPAEVRRTAEQAMALNRQYLNIMEVPQSMIDRMSATSPYGISWANAAEMRTMIYPASTLQKLDSCRSDLYVFECYVRRLYAMRDGMPEP